jgi:hypothetical protein
MARIDDILPKSNDWEIFAFSKEAQDLHNSKEKIEREKESVRLQGDVAKRLQDLEVKYHKQREIDKQERAKEKEIEHIQRQEERRSDRWFAAKTLIIAAILGALLTKLFDFIFR